MDRPTTAGGSLEPLRREALELAEDIGRYLHGALSEIDTRVAMPPDPDAALAEFVAPLPEGGAGMRATLERLLDLQHRAGTNTAGPRCFHFVIGGNTPAAHGADLIASAFDVLTYSWVVSPVGVRLEQQALAWLRELLGIPSSMAGVMVTGATMANFTGLAAARQWWGEHLGFDVSDAGLAEHPPIRVLTSGYVHAATRKVLGLLGIGRGRIEEYRVDDRGRLDVAAFERALEGLDGAPALVVVNAGEVNAGDFDPVETMVDLGKRHGCWVHIDGAFGLFAAVSPRTAHLVRGLERADSITVDGHKWLNLPYDSGYAFVRDPALLARAFRYSADYLPSPDDPRPTPGAFGPESSRRGRSFAVWATLHAYGRDGHRAIVEHCLDLAQHLAHILDETPGLTRMAEVPLNIVAFRFDPAEIGGPGLDDAALDTLNQQLGEDLIADGRFLVGTSKLGARTILRPAFSNWRTRFEDVEEFARVVVELGRRRVAQEG